MGKRFFLQVDSWKTQHGTGEKYVASINEIGLISKSRLYVHLSDNTETAYQVGRRHGRAVVYRVLAGKMQKDGYIFYLSKNGVWLTKEVPVQYLESESEKVKEGGKPQ